MDMKLLKKNGIIHKYFLHKEKKLYQLSDKIGCLSEANIEYLKKHNSYLDFKKIEINPNTISPKFINYSSSEKENIKLKNGAQQKIKFKRGLRVNHVYLSHSNFVSVDCASLRLPARNFI